MEIGVQDRPSVWRPFATARLLIEAVSLDHRLRRPAQHILGRDVTEQLDQLGADC